MRVIAAGEFQQRCLGLLDEVGASGEPIVITEALEGFGSADPADRFLVATALEHKLVLVTADGAMRDYEPVPTLW